MAHELVIKTRIVHGSTFRNVSIGIDNGKISAVKPNLRGEKEFHFEDYLALPGGVDIHTHMREPGFEKKEDFFTGTRSAAFGGTTTILDMPNTEPAVTTVRALEEKLDLVADKANVDFGLFGQLSDVDEIEKMTKLAIGFKLFMADTTATVATTSPPEILLNSGHLAGRVVTVHAEDPELFAREECTDLHRHNLIRNMRAETEAVKKILSIESPVKLNLAHLTTTDSVDMARKGKATFEITPHHVLLDESMDLGTNGKVNPPLRKRAIADRLFDVLKTGRAIIASDHAPHAADEKSLDFTIAPSGIPGVETRVPLMLALAQKGMLKHSAVQDMCSQLPAGLFGLKKGRIELGYDADIAFYDLDNMIKIDAANLHSKCGWTPFGGFDAIFPAGVMLRGNMIIRGGELVLERTGKNLR
ncbi:MAG: dihydroorotase [Candidatus Thermoplasmatota archaeon]|nr:dihydroorotase [Candidatus Thermoplasmatota archaeon]MBU4071412.1 dihydroorotase [Candidatus Thermoplasmatota archaeon]MBU4144459.1 dihydroorotase [Candidatus Thermoplasmatota archaeon]MBU4592309.1 dihydroorotase [Candidatus Thermoplasmatota archaeon]